jgi:hypothetical protein
VSEVRFTEKLIAFVDVLGFKNLVEAAEEGNRAPLNAALSVLEKYGGANHRKDFIVSGHNICPQSQFITRGLDFRATRVSDCLVISSEVSPAGAINLLQHCWGFALNLLANGLMCRGFVTRGNIYHTDDQFVGTGYQKAQEREPQVTAFKREADERGTPFIEIDRPVCDYIAAQSDACVKQIFGRMVKGDGDIMAVFPFQTFEHSFVIGGLWGNQFDAQKERESNQNLRMMLTDMKQKVSALIDVSNPRAVQKGEHYMRALDAQLAVCDGTGACLLQLETTFPRPH